MIKKTALLAITFCLLFTIFGLVINPVVAQNQGQINVSNNTIQSNYPLSLSFSSQISDSVNITDIRLQYQVEQMSFAQVISEDKIDFTPGTTVNARYDLNMLTAGQIPPGINIDYWWIVEDAAGNKLKSDPAHFQVYDDKHKWTSLDQGQVHLLWYGQNASFGQTVMSTAQNALAKLSTDTGASPEKTINLSVYTSEKEYASSVLGASEWSGGVTLLGYNSILLLIRPGAMMDVDLSGVSHELTHVIVSQVTFNPYNTTPFWMNEGLAMYIQYPSGELPAQFSNALNQAIGNNSLITVRSLSSPFSAYSDKANLSYAESFSIITYLIDQYGSSKMLEFLDTFKQGSTYDGALQANYGFDMDGLFNQWKTWVSAK